MGILSRKRIGGGIMLVVAGWLGQETLSWLLSKALDLASDGAGRVTIAAFPWQNAIAAVLALVGAFLAFWPVKAKEKPATRADRLSALYYRGDLIVDQVRYNRQLEWFERGRGEKSPVDIARDGLSVLLDYQNQGLPIPQFGAINSAEKLCVGLESYFSAVGPFMRDGHVAQVDAMAAGVAETALGVAGAFNPEKWYVERY